MFDDVEIKAWVLILTLAVVLAVIALISAALWLYDKKRGKTSGISSRDITYGSMSLAMAFVLSMFSFVKMPQDGSITPASTVPLIIYCYFFGLRKGMFVSTVYMLLQLLYFPTIVSPYSAVLDYAVPYMALALTGVFSFSQKKYQKILDRKEPVIKAHLPIYVGCALYILVRYSSHVISGVLYYGDWAWEGWSVWPYSLAYNAIYCLGDFAVAMVALTALLCSKSFNAFMASHGNTFKNSDTAAKDNQRT